MCGWKTLPDGRKIYISCAKRNTVIGLVLALGVAGGGGISASAGAAADASAAARSATAARSTPKSSGRAERRIFPSDIARKLKRVARSANTSSDAGVDCVAHAYGQVQEWLRRHPCIGFARTLAELELPGGGRVLVAVAAVEMPDTGEARELRALMDRGGTGNVTGASTTRAPVTARGSTGRWS